MVKTKRVWILALVALGVALIIGIIAFYTGDTKQVLEGTLVRNSIEKMWKGVA